LSEKECTWKIIIVGDGSDDEGKGSALRSGILHANGLFRIFTARKLMLK